MKNTLLTDNDLLIEALKMAKIGVWRVDIATQQAHWSKEVYEIHEVPFGTPIPLADGINYYREDFRPIIRNVLNQAIEKQERWDVRCVLVTATGKEIWVRSIGNPVFVEGQLTELRGLFQDIDQIKRQEELLEANEFKFRSIFNHTFNFIGLLEPDGTLIEVNEVALDFGALTLEQVRGQCFHEANFWSKNKAIKAQTKAAIERAAEGEFVRYEVEIVGAQHNLMIDFSISPIFDASGKVVYLVPDGRDITERVKLEDSLNAQLLQLKRFVTYAPAAVAMFDKDMRYIAASNHWYQDYQLEGRDIIGERHYDIFPEILEMPDWLAIHQRVLSGEEYVTDKDRFEREDGSVKWLSYSLIPWYEEAEGEVAGMIMYTADVTSQVEYQEKLKNLNKDLEERVEKRTLELQRLNKELEQFVYIASHDLQEPLRTISNYVEVINTEKIDTLDEETRHFINRIGISTKRANKLVKGLLDYSRAGKIEEVEWVDTNQLVREVLQDLEARISSCQATVRLGNLPRIHGSTGNLRQLFQNLISNAIKYRSPDRNPAVVIQATDQSGTWVFSVQDNGIGIEAEHFTRIFKIFQRLHNKSAFEGTGIGLALCKKIVESYGGNIWVESKPEQGCNFFFTLEEAFPLSE